jgi:hypothetical protein
MVRIGTRDEVMTAKELLPFIVVVSFLLALVCAAVAAYALSSQKRGETVRRSALWVAAAVWILVAFIVTLFFAIPILDDFRIHGIPPKQLTLESVVVGAICLSLWIIALRRTFQASRQAWKMKSGAALVLATLFFVALSWGAFARRDRLVAKLWHWRHGNSVIVSGYQVPVPDDWLVRNQTDDHVELVATGTDERGPVFAHILVSTNLPQSYRPRDLTYWRSSREQFLRDRGFNNIEENTLHFDGEIVVCVGRLINLACMSTSPLNFMYVGQESDTAQFEAVVSGIHKR